MFFVGPTYSAAGVYLDFLTRGYGCSVGGNRPNRFCKCDIVGQRTTFYIVMRDVNMTTIDKTHDAV